MEHAQEAIQDYEDKIQQAGQVNIAKIVTNNAAKAITMIFDHEYHDGIIYYKAQWQDGFQKWVKDPDNDLWKDLIEEYWNNELTHQLNSPKEEPWQLGWLS